jgi:hypothetical protein
VCRLAGRAQSGELASGGNGSRVVRGAAPVMRAYEKYMEGASGVYGRCTTLGMSFVRLSMPGVRDYPAGWCSRGRFPWKGAR